jgi:hypothetical protein
VALIETAPKRRDLLIRYPTLRRGQCFQNQYPKLRQFAQAPHDFCAQFVGCRVLFDAQRVVRIAGQLHDRQLRMPVRSRQCSKSGYLLIVLINLLLTAADRLALNTQIDQQNVIVMVARWSQS